MAQRSPFFSSAPTPVSMREIRRQYNQANLIGFDFDRDMLARARLGRMIRMWGVSKSTAARWLAAGKIAG